ncbi:glycoside hydrolase family 2 protein [Plantactinospora siamensis]|uniref:beta-mannosidase n=1 Tax=Plantactinospora siamensis TaxID=555372 RepID=A0ABV6NT85_9ACTN
MTASVRPLHDGWTLRAEPGPDVPAELIGVAVPATVPGCVHTDLLAAGLIPDPYLDANETALSWIGRTDWTYETSFDWAGADTERVDLVCAGLDTVATVLLNDVELGRTANMHRGWRYDVRATLRPGRNVLRVRFGSAYRYAEAMRDRLGDRPNAYPEPFNFIRKMACNFGWDWGPNLVTAGIWQPISVHCWDTARLAEVRPLVTVEEGRGRVAVHVRLDRAGDGPVRVAAALTGAPDGPAEAAVTVPAGERTAVLDLTVADPELWWPRGYGGQPRYPLAVTLHDTDADAADADPDADPDAAADADAGGGGSGELDRVDRLIGFRTVSLETTPDALGTPFTLVVNGRPVFVRGANWIPDDAFPTRVTRERYARRLDQAVGANLNLLRVWGGGRYESDDFYDLADSLGLLVQQDFLFACAAYPEEGPFPAEVAAEAREQVARLAGHPSLVLWTGCNENIWGFHDWDWRAPLAGRSWGEGYYLDLLPGIVAELDPTVPYWPGSPWSGRADLHPNDPGHGTMHIWDVWNDDDYTKYRQYVPRFAAEFGWQAPPAYATLRRALSDEPLAHDSPGMAHHQKAIDGDRKLQRGLDAHLPAPRDFDDWHYLTQVVQARAVACGIEHFRAHRPVCMGTIMWQLNDCWPVTSWSAVDGDGRRKPLWYALRRSYADRLLTVQPHEGGLVVVAVNETATPWAAEVALVRLTLDGEPRAKASLPARVPAYSAVALPVPTDLADPERPRNELLLADAESAGAARRGEAGDAERALWFFAEDRDLEWPVADYTAEVDRVTGGYRVRVNARTLLRDLTLLPDRLDPGATVDDALRTLLPGETATFTVSTSATLDPAALVTRPVLRCINDIR